MKNFFTKIVAVALSISTSITFMACSSDKDDAIVSEPQLAVSESQLIGLWEMTEEIGYVSYNGQTQSAKLDEKGRMKIKSDYTCDVYEWNNNSKQYVKTSEKRTWSLSGNEFTLTINNSKISKATIKSLTSTVLVMVVKEKDEKKGYETELHSSWKRIE